MPMTTSFPTTKQTFAEQTDVTVPGAGYPNTLAATVEAIEDWVGGNYSLTGDPNLTGRVLALEASSSSRRTFANVAPSDLALQEWFDTSDPANWLFYIQAPDLTWKSIGGNAVTLRGLPISTTPPTDGETPYWNATAGQIQWSAAGGFNNPLTASQDILIGTTPIVGTKATLGRLPVGTADQMLITNGTGALAWINQPTPGIPTTVLAHTNGLIIGGTVTGTVATPVELPPGTINQVLQMLTGTTMGWSTPNWIPAPGGAPQGSVLYLDSDGAWHYLPPPSSSTQFLRGAAAGNPYWSDLPTSPPGSGIVAPTGTTIGSLLTYTTDWTNLAPGAAGTFLKSNGSTSGLSWATPPVGLTNPMGTTGAMIYSSNSSGLPASLVVGTHADGEILTLVGSIPAWAPRANPFTIITTAGDLLVGTGAGTVGRLGSSATTGQVLTTTAANTLGWTTPTTYGVFSNTTNGLVPSSGANNDASHVLAGNGTWVAMTGGGGGTYSVFTSTVDGLVPASGASNDATHVLAGNHTWVALPPTYANFTSSVAGLVPAPGGSNDTSHVLSGAGTWITFPGGGNVISVEDEGGAPATVATLNFVGPGIIVTAVGSVATVGVPYFTGSIAGVVPASPNNTTTFLRADGSWAALATLDHVHQGGAGDGGPLDGSEIPTWLDFANHAVPSTPLAAHGRIYSKAVSSVAHPFWIGEDGTEHDLLAAGSSGSVFSTATNGLVPGPTSGEANTSHVLTGAGTWAVAASGGSGIGALFDVNNNYVAPPAASSLTKINGGTTGTDTGEVDNAHGLTLWNHCSGDTARAWIVGNLPGSGDWSWKALIHVTSRAWDQSMCGVAIFEAGTDPKAVLVGLQHNQTSGPQFIGDKWNVLSGGTANYGGDYVVERYFSHYLWVKIAHSGTHRNIEFSDDGQNWVRACGLNAYGTDPSTTDWITPTRYGFLMFGNNGGAYQYMTILSAELTTP